VEAMSEHQRANRALIETMIRDALGGAVEGKVSRGQAPFTLSRTQAEWLLEVLNDVRVGCWVRLGRPDQESVRALKLSAANVADFGAMELAGYWQSLLLEALGG